jgi:uncharacterized protein (TIGR02646 family)
MRPVAKWAEGFISPSGHTVQRNYNPYGTANPVLIENLDDFCSYCEGVTLDPEVEHIISKNQNRSQETEWTNFLMACGRCNGNDNKGYKPVDLNAIYLPHIHNTFLVFEYKEGGFIGVNNALTPPQALKATALMDLLCLDKYPNNPKYSQGFPLNDKRWEHRRVAWEKAMDKLSSFESGEITSPQVIAEFAHQRGFFSIWFTVFKQHRAVREALVNTFRGTDRSSFDDDFMPQFRNRTNQNDPI